MRNQTKRMARYYVLNQIVRALYRILPPSLRRWIPSYLVRQALEDVVDSAQRGSNRKSDGA